MCDEQRPVRARLSTLSPHQPCRAADRVPSRSQVLMALKIACTAGLLHFSWRFDSFSAIPIYCYSPIAIRSLLVAIAAIAALAALSTPSARMTSL